MKLTELYPQFLAREDDSQSKTVDTLAEADGIMFLCPKCFVANGGPMGTHVIICWKPSVPLTASPSPGRWNMRGTGYGDLSLDAGSSSIQLTGGCRWHGFVKDGKITDASG